FLRTGFEMFSTGKSATYVAEKAESNAGWMFPVGDEAHELGYPNMFTDMFQAIEKGRQPLETFYDGYIVNAILDAAYKSVETRCWEPVIIDDWRGKEIVDNTADHISYDDDYFLIKKELMPNNELKLILKNKNTGAILH